MARSPTENGQTEPAEREPDPPATAAARALAQRLAALPELAMRRVTITEWIVQNPVQEVVEALSVVVRRGRVGGPPFYMALMAFVAALSEEGTLPYDLRRELYALAKDHGYDDVAYLFLSAIEHRTEAPIGTPLAAKGRPLTLGERKQLARGGKREVLARLLRDPDPSVIRLLLGNPHLTELDVVTVAARRPTSPELQREVFQSKRWIARYRIKRTLVLNPYTSSDLAVRLLGFLSDADLKLVADDTELAPGLRQAATRMAGRANPS